MKTTDPGYKSSIELGYQSLMIRAFKAKRSDDPRVDYHKIDTLINTEKGLVTEKLAGSYDEQFNWLKNNILEAFYLLIERSKSPTAVKLEELRSQIYETDSFEKIMDCVLKAASLLKR